MSETILTGRFAFCTLGLLECQHCRASSHIRSAVHIDCANAQDARGRQRRGRDGHALEDRNREQLYEIAKDRGIAGRSKMGKWDLIEAIRKSR